MNRFLMRKWVNKYHFDIEIFVDFILFFFMFYVLFQLNIKGIMDIFLNKFMINKHFLNGIIR